ncbi:flagellar protein FliT [Bacillus kexueae]|uniref:flagellar protein FliT n=1 Tax=Aeribacillus kexueae TaxID=2078952 RepID=UPI001FAE865F|nr:flagellar protein FliT [Bacillus kexueae]
MDRINRVIQLTEQLLQLTAETNEKNRDEQIEKLQSLLAQREEALKDIVPPFSSEEMEKGRQLFPLDEQLKKQLEAMKFEIKNKILQVKKTKQSARKYVNPYQQQTIDGMFYDKRK